MEDAAVDGGARGLYVAGCLIFALVSFGLIPVIYLHSCNFRPLTFPSDSMLIIRPLFFLSPSGWLKRGPSGIIGSNIPGTC